MKLLQGLRDIYKVIIRAETRLYQVEFYKNKHCIYTFAIYGKNVLDNIMFHYRLQNITFNEQTPSIYTTTFYSKTKFYTFIDSLHTLEDRYSMFIF